MTHTPGPWISIDTDGEHHAIVSPDSDQDHFTIICIGPDDAAENSNARLIAAAPELLAELENCLAIVESEAAQGPTIKYRRDIATARAAITKAKGE
jgi:hypothetical protein